MLRSNEFGEIKADLISMTQIEDAYFDWLVEQIEIPRKKSYLGVLERMHNTEFVWTVANDSNRIQDALDLRFEFSGKRKVMPEKGASVLEVLVSLSRRVAFTANGDRPRFWAWTLFENLGLHQITDPLTDEKSDEIEQILESLIWRVYKRDGRGGFFPLHNPTDDQTKVEIWFQMNSYIMEIEGV